MDGENWDDIDRGSGWHAVRPPMEPALLADDGDHVAQLLNEYQSLWLRLERVLEERLEVLTVAARGA